MSAPAMLLALLTALGGAAGDDDPSEVVEPLETVENLWDRGTFTEGGATAADGSILFSDIGDRIMRFNPSTGETTVFREPGGRANGMIMDAKGRLIVAEGANTGGGRRISVTEPDGECRTLADRFEGKRFNSPNDVVVKSNGDVYFTDPPYGLLGENHDQGKELAFSGVYRRSADGKVTLLTRELGFPNGLAFSPDEKTLYVANSDFKRAIWMAYPVADDGTLKPGRLFADVTSRVGKFKGLPDGLKVDEAGNVFATGPGGVLIFSPDGKHLGTLATGEACGNCAWGEDGSVLYVASDMYIGRIPTKTRGRIPGVAQP